MGCLTTSTAVAPTTTVATVTTTVATTTTPLATTQPASNDDSESSTQAAVTTVIGVVSPETTDAAAVTATTATTTTAAGPPTSLDWAIAAGYATAPPSAAESNTGNTDADTNAVTGTDTDTDYTGASTGRKLSGPQLAGVGVAIIMATIVLGVLRWKSMVTSSGRDDHDARTAGAVNPTYDSRSRTPPPTVSDNYSANDANNLVSTEDLAVEEFSC